jgi:hypothetical protein
MKMSMMHHWKLTPPKHPPLFCSRPTPSRPATPTFDEYAPSPAHDDVRLAQTPTAPQLPSFLPLDVGFQEQELKKEMGENREKNTD